jgi:hypothetical protein
MGVGGDGGAVVAGDVVEASDVVVAVMFVEAGDVLKRFDSSGG